MKRKLIALILTLALMLPTLIVSGIIPAGADDNVEAIDLPGCARVALFEGYGEQSRKRLADRLQRYEAVLYNDVATDEEFETAWYELQAAYDSLKPMHGFELIPLNGFGAWTDDDLAAMIESSSTPVFDRDHAPEGVGFAIAVSGEGGAVFSNGANRSGVAGQSPFGLDMSKADGLKLWLFSNTGVSKYTVTIGLRSGVDNYAYTAVVYGVGYVYIPFEYFTTTGEYPLAKDGSMNYIRIESEVEEFCVADFNAYNEILESSASAQYSETQISARNQIVNNAYYKIIETGSGKAVTLGPPVSETAIRWGNTLAVEDSSLKYSLEENREGDRTQMWQLSPSPTGNNTFRIINKSSSNVLTISESGVNVEAKEINLNETHQEWAISISAGKATLQVRNVGKLTTAGDTVKATNGTAYKKFYLYRVVETEYVQSWSDEFDGDSLDRTKWNVSDGQTDGAIYPDDDDLIDVSNGNLNFRSEYKRSDAYEMRGTYMNTSGKFAFGYGKIEIRAKLAYGTGQFPAFWLMPTDMMNMGAGEVDIMEMVVGSDINDNGTVIGTVHWTNDEGSQEWSKVVYMKINGYGEKYLSDEYHTYGLEMDRDQIRYYFDGMQYNSLLYNSDGKKFAFGDTARYIIFNNTPRARTPSGNDGYPSNIVDEAWGAEEEYVINVDYVRCFLESGEITDNTEDFTTDGSINYSTGLNAVAINDYWDINFPTDVKPDGTEAASADHMKKVYIFDPVTNVTKYVLSTGFDRALRVVYSPDGSKLAVASTQGNIAIYDTSDYTKAPRKISNGVVIQENVLFTKDSSALIVGGFNGGSQKYSPSVEKWCFRVFDATSGAKLQQINVGSDPRFIALSDDGSKLAVTTTSNGTFVYNTSDWSEYAHFTEGHVRAIRGADFSSDARLLVTSDDNGVICLWDVENKAFIKNINNVNTGSVRRIVFSPDDKYLLCTSTYGAARLFDVDSGELVSLLGGFGNVIREASYSPNGKYIVVASYDGGAKLFAADGTYLETLKAGETDENLEGYIVSRIKFMPDSSYVFFAQRTYPHSLQKWALPQQLDKSTLEAALLKGNPSNPGYEYAAKVATLKYATPHMMDKALSALVPRPMVVYDSLRASSDAVEFSNAVDIIRCGYVYFESVNSPYYEHLSMKIKNTETEEERFVAIDKDTLLSVASDINYTHVDRLMKIRFDEPGTYQVSLYDEVKNKSFASVTVTVDGTKTATDEYTYTINEATGEVTITNCISGKRDVVIPDEIEGYPVTAIGDYAFAGYGRTVHHMTVKLPSTLTTIKQYAFNACSSLREIEFPASLKTIGQYAFNDCRLLGCVDIPDGVSVNTYAFRNTGIGTVTVGPGVNFTSAALSGNYRARELIVRDGTTAVTASLGTQYIMEAVYIPESVTSISGTLFSGNMKKVKLYGIEGSYAQTYAESYPTKFDFVPLGAPVISGVEEGATYDLYEAPVTASWNDGHIAYLNGERRYYETDVTEPGEYTLKVINGYDDYSTTVHFTVIDTTPPPYTVGDVDDDGEIGVTDAVAALRIALGIAEPQGYQSQSADIDGDGKITVSDALRILRVAAGCDL